MLRLRITLVCFPCSFLSIQCFFEILHSRDCCFCFTDSGKLPGSVSLSSSQDTFNSLILVEGLAGLKWIGKA